MKVLIKHINLVFSILLIIAAGFLAFVAIPSFGSKALIVRSGSMQPAINVGDLIVVQLQNNLASPVNGNFPKYKVGEIVAFKSEKNPKVFTSHRIASSQFKEGKISYGTKGDANDAPDKNLVTEENIVGKKLIVIPYIGKLLAFAKSKTGFAAVVITPALLVIFFEIVSIFKEIRRQNRIVDLPPAKASSFTPLMIIFPILVSVTVMHNAFAFFSDTETSTNNTFTAAEVFSPGSGDVIINEIMWQGSSDEWIELRNTTGHTIDISQWTIENAASVSNPIQISPSTTLPAGALYLIAKNKNSSTINVDPDQTTASVSLLDGGEVLTLKTNTSQTIDTAFTGSGWFFSASTPRKSVERKSPPGDGTQAANWQNSAAHTNMDGSGPTDEFGTPKATNSAP